MTEADERAEALIVAGAARAGARRAGGRRGGGRRAAQCPRSASCFWLVDPLDGTKEFISRNGEFTVNIALIERRRAGARRGATRRRSGRLFCRRGGQGALRGGRARPARRSAARGAGRSGLTVVASRSHGDAAALDAFLGRAQGRRDSPTPARR
ncbi:MAG: hypothetical protein MZW92_74935 [Comamonadaceae bacterium]|nr:hypothetical protein [Comamonadaceae bacterium]